MHARWITAALHIREIKNQDLISPQLPEAQADGVATTWLRRTIYLCMSNLSWRYIRIDGG